MQPFERLEHEWAKFNDLDPAGMVACSSGTSALHLAFESIRLPTWKNCYGICCDFNMIAVPRALVMAGLECAFVDCDNKLLIDVDKLFDLGADATFNVHGQCAVVIATHIYGRRCDMGGVVHFADDYGVFVVEDLAEAHGVKPHPGTNAACWSFYRNKQVAGEEGGAVWFRDPLHAKLARQLRSLGFTDAHDYRHLPRGHNYRMSDLHAEAILGRVNGGCSDNSLTWIDRNQNKRREIESWYDEYCPVEWRQPPRDAVWVYDFRVPGMTHETQDRVVRTLRDNKIEARHGFKPMHAQEEFKGCRRVGGENAERASREVIYLPVQPGVTTRADAERAFDIVRSVVDRT